MGTDGAWRWRKGVEDKYHYRFWGQVVRWMAYQRNMAKGETMRLYYVPDQPRMHQTLTLHANVMDRGGEPLRQGDVSARITAPSGKAEVVRFALRRATSGACSPAGSPPTSRASTRSTLVCKQTGATLEASFFVQGVAAERVGRPARPEVLEEIARVTRGKVVGADKLDEVVRSLADLPDPPAVGPPGPALEPPGRGRRRWSALLGIFWVGRKAVGLV